MIKEKEIEELRFKIQQLEELTNDLKGLIENSYDGLAILDKDTRIIMVNPAFEKIMGSKKEELIGRTVKERVAMTKSDPGASLKVIETLKPHTVIMKTRAGRQALSTAIPVFDEKGNLYRIYINLRDITELNRLKEKFEESQALISKYREELNEVKQYTIQSEFIAHSQKMKQVIETANRTAKTDATVLILGESGVGKEMVARMIHNLSPRGKSGPFIKVNCGAIPGELLESELFGYEAGSFTGASKEGKPGYFEIADKGTIFLDEIGDMPMKLQVKLLSVLQDHEITRVGGLRPKKVDVRIIAATNKDLKKMVISGKFREDLFYRLNVIPILIPPLRERKEDVPFLLTHYLKLYNRKYKLKKIFAKEAIDILCDYTWPGNVRELANLVERLVVTCNQDLIKPEHLPKEYMVAHVYDIGSNQLRSVPLRSLKEQVREYELNMIKQVLSNSKNLAEAAYILGISLSTLTRRLRILKNRNRRAQK